MLKGNTIAFIVCFVLFFPLLSFGFDCNKPQFGARLEDIDKEGYFVKYMEQNGISYYNFTGPCRKPVHEDFNPAISYLFIDNQLYARIVTIPSTNKSVDEVRAIIERNMAKLIGTAQRKVKQDGDWWVYQWSNEETKLKIKTKINRKTGLTKGGIYYEPLREKLKNTAGSVDSVEEIE